MKKDLKNRKDIELLVDSFYEKIKANTAISYFFNEVTKVSWESHLPKMYDFFENIVFFSGNYEGNPMVTHQDLHKKSPVNYEHFKQWNELFDATVDELFQGKNANEIKQRAKNISEAMMHKTL